MSSAAPKTTPRVGPVTQRLVRFFSDREDRNLDAAERRTIYCLSDL